MEEERTATSVAGLEGDERVQEVARMLAGRKVTELSLSHARELIDGADEDERAASERRRTELPRRVALDAVLADPELLGRLSSLLDRPGVLVIPTESSYGLAADPRSAEGVATIYPTPTLPVKRYATHTRARQHVHRHRQQRTYPARSRRIYLFVFVNEFAANDHDAFAVRCTNNFQTWSTVLRYTSALEDSTRISTAYVASPARWVVAFETMNATRSRIGVSFHDSASTTTNGVLTYLTAPSGMRYRAPDVGGTARGTTGDNALIVFEREHGTVVRSYGIKANASTRALGFAVFALVPNPLPFSGNESSPAVSQLSAGTSPAWITCWSEHDLSAWAVRGARVSYNGGPTSAVTLVTNGLRHALAPAIAGANGRYLLAWGSTADAVSTAMTEIRVARLNWGNTSSAFNLGPARLVDTAVPGVSVLQATVARVRLADAVALGDRVTASARSGSRSATHGWGRPAESRNLATSTPRPPRTRPPVP